MSHRTIIFSQFYQASAMQEKVLSTTLTFIDQQISLKNYVEKINNATSFDDISKQYTAETYNGVLNSNTSRSARHKRQADNQVAMASKLDARIEAIADQYLDKYDHRLSKTSHTHKKIGKNQESKSSLPIKVKNFEFTERKGSHPHSNSKQIHPANDRGKPIPSQYPKNLKQNSQSVVTKQGISNAQPNWFTAKSDTKKLSNFYRPIKHLTDKQQLAKPLISKTHPISPKFIGQQQGRHLHHQRLPLSRVTAMPDITGALMVFDVFMRKATRENYRQPISEQIAKRHRKMERQLEISKAKTFRLPLPKSIEIKAHGFGLR
ncbi:MAG: hypothetical protein RJA83_488 [Pseudomonadota bacterium]|jgi:hypothetical protein